MEFTKEQLIEKLKHRISVASGFPESEKAQMDLEMARIALASLEAEPAIHRWRRVTSEPYGPYPWHYGDFIGFSKPVDGIEDEYFYSATPAPANAEPVAWLWSHRKHPSEVTLVRPEDDERAEGAHWSGWSCQALYAAPPTPVSVPDYPETLPCPVMLEPGLRFGKGVNTRTMLGALQRRAAYHAELEAMTPEKRAEHDAGMKEFAAMLQGAAGNSPVIPDGWVACSERMPVENDIVLVVDDGYFVCEAQYRDGDFYSAVRGNGEFFETTCRDVELWMPLPAAPQQEVKP